MRAFELIESFDQPYNYTWEAQTNGAWRSRFITKDNDYVDVNIENWGKYWRVEFSRNSSSRITGGGDAMRIFSTVISAIDEFIDVMSPDIIKFSAEKSSEERPSRKKLYTQLIKRFAAVNGYNSQESRHDDNIEYVLTRKIR